jgi:UDP-glucose:(heptosyl)LPS alpha-1,3-glucosyltransferase
MKIAFCLFKYFPYGGLQRDFLAIAAAALARGHEIDVYTLEWQGEIPQYFNVHVVPVKGWMNHTRCAQFSNYVHSEALQQKYDLLVGFNKIKGLDVYFAGEQCYAANPHRLKHFWYRWSPRYHYFLKAEQEVFNLMSSTEILALTERQVEDFSTHYAMPREQFHLLSPKIPKDRMRPAHWQDIRSQLRKEFGIAEDEFLLLLVGSGFRTKGLDRALLGLQSLPTEIRQKTHFFVIGQDKEQFFVKLAKRLGVNKQLTFLAGRNDVPNFMFAADLLIHPAYAETAGNVLIEAIAAGLPSIVTDVCGYAFHVAAADAGRLISTPFEQNVFNQTLLEMLLHTNRKQLSQNGLEYCQQHLLFDMPNSVVDLLETTILENKRHPRNQLRRQLLDQKNFKEILSMQGDVYRELEGRRTLRFERDGHAYFAKIHQGVGMREIFKNLLQGRFPVVGALAEYKAVLRLKQLGIDTLSVVAFSQRGINPATLKSFIVTDELSNTVSLEQYCRDWTSQPPSFLFKQSIIKAIARIARTLHVHGVNHRDFYAAHLHLDISQPATLLTGHDLKLYLIDLHRMQLRKQVPLRWVTKDIAALYFSVMDFGLTDRDLLRFIKLYQGKRLNRALTEDARFWKKVIKQGIYLYHKANHKAPHLSRRVLEYGGFN